MVKNSLADTLDMGHWCNNSPLNRSLSLNSSTKTSVRFLPWPPKIEENRDSVDSFRFGFLRSLVPSFLPVPFFVTFSSSDVELLSHAFFATGFAFSSYKNTFFRKNCSKVNTKNARLQKIEKFKNSRISIFESSITKGHFHFWLQSADCIDEINQIYCI